MGQKLMLIINPMAGKSQYKNVIATVLEVLCKSGYTVTVHMTEHPGHAAELAREHGGDYDVLVCCGGDGTLSEVIAGLMGLESRPLLGYIPMGTTNDMASTLGLPKNAGRAAQIITAGHTIPFDVGQMGNHYFTYIAAFGAFTEVSYETAQESKQMLGHFAYIMEGLGHIGKVVPHRLTVECGDTQFSGEYIFGGITNSTSVAGLVKLKPDLVDLGDGQFEVILVTLPKNLIELNNILMGLATQNYNSDYVTLFQADKVKFTFEKPVTWTRDGESGGVYQEVTLENIKEAVRIFVP